MLAEPSQISDWQGTATCICDESTSYTQLQAGISNEGQLEDLCSDALDSYNYGQACPAAGFTHPGLPLNTFALQVGLGPLVHSGFYRIQDVRK
jgi:hypothetical protein